MVTRQDQDIFRIIPLDKVDILIDRICGAGVPVGAGAFLVGRQDKHAAVAAVEIPRLAVADILIQDQRLILGQHAHSVDPRVDAVGQRKINDPIFSAERNCRFCKVLGQRIKPAALTACQQHGNPFLFAKHG